MSWGGNEINFDITVKKRKMDTSMDYLAGICSVLYLFSDSMAASFMLIMVENKCLDPVKILEPYLINKTELSSNVLTNLKKEIPQGNYCIIGHMKNYFLLKFNNKDFLDGISFCCKLLKRDPKNIIIENNFQKKPKDYFIHGIRLGSLNVKDLEKKPLEQSFFHSAPPSSIPEIYHSSPMSEDNIMEVRRNSSRM